jgi:hypothetical protein
MDYALQFPIAQVPHLAGRYPDDDTNILEAGRRIANGEYKGEHLATIFEWKTRGRGRSRIQRNTQDEIADALRLAVLAETERSALSVLTGLSGVDVPVASAILTAVNPTRFTILDFRALYSLGIVKTAPYSAGFYLEYLGICRRVAADASIATGSDIDLRTLDRALWQYSKENQDPKTRATHTVSAACYTH